MGKETVLALLLREKGRFVSGEAVSAELGITRAAIWKSISALTLLEAPEFGNVDCTVIVTAFRDGKQIGTLNTELTLHTAYLWPKEVR